MDLIQASRRGDLTRVNQLLALPGTNVNMTNVAGVTPLFVAVRNGHIEVVKVLLKAGADINMSTSFGYPLLTGFIIRNLEMVKLLLKEGADPLVVDSKGNTILHLANENQWESFFPDLLELVDGELDLDTKNKRDQTPLFLSITNNNIEITKILLSHGANPNIKGFLPHSGGSAYPLQQAVFRGNNEAILELLLAGADPDAGKSRIPNVSRTTPFIEAFLRRNVYAIKLMLKFGANINDPSLKTYMLYHSIKDDMLTLFQLSFKSMRNHGIDVRWIPPAFFDIEIVQTD